MNASLDNVPTAEATDDDIACVLDWLKSSSELPDGIVELLKSCRGKDVESDVWLLAHCVDGVVWGKVEPSGTCSIAAGSPDSGPPIPSPSRDNVLELRLFGANAELLLWRDGVAAQTWSGRWLDDQLLPLAPAESLLAPRSVPMLVLGTPRQTPNALGAFTLLDDGAGRRHLVPLVLAAADDGAPPAVLDTRQYLTRDETGVVRVSASRLVRLRARKKDELHVDARSKEAK